MLTPEKYQKLQALLADNTKDLSDEVRQQAQAAVDGYKNDFLARGAAAGEKPPAEGESDRILSVGRAVPPGQPHPDEARVQQLVSQLDPSLSLPAQVLAMQPGTNHPGGDEAARDEWIRGDLNNPNGVIVAYEMPVSEVRKKLLEKPELYRALQMSVPTDPESVMSIQEGDSTHQAYNDYFFKEAADAATKAGKSIYRRSKAPWLGDGQGASTLDALRTKYDTMSPTAGQAFVLGYDDTANFGAGKAAQESGAFGPDAEDLKYMTGPKRKPGFETVGGMPEGLPTQERNDALEESHPVAHTLGQAAGIANPLSLTGRLWGWLTEPAAAGAKTALGGLARGGARGAGAGAAEQTVREGAQAASSYSATGDAGTTLGESAGRVLGAAAAGMVPEALGGGIRGASNRFNERVQWGPRYGGAPGRVEAHGVEPKLFKGHEAPPVVQEATLRGRMEGGRDALTVLADDLNAPLRDTARGRVTAAEQAAEQTVATHRASPEAGYTLPARNLVEKAAEKLRELTSEIPKKDLEGVAKPRSDAQVRGVFNTNIEGVSLKPTKNGVVLTAKEAKSFLSPEWLDKLDPKDLAKKDARVYVTPRRYDSAHADEVIDQLAKSKDEHMLALHDAARQDRAARGTGDYAAARDKHDATIDTERSKAQRIGAHKKEGVRGAVEEAGKKRGQGKRTQALRDEARTVGGDAPEKLRGALIAEDLRDIEDKSAFAGRNPLSGVWNLWGMGDKTVLKTVYPASRKLQTTKPGAASKAGRAAAAVTRNVTDDRADDRRRERDEKKAEGYGERAKEAEKNAPKTGKRKLKPWKRSTSEAQR